MKANTVMYKGINMVKYEMNFKEKFILETFKKELVETFNESKFDFGRFSDENEFKFKYHNKMGYFVLFKKNGNFDLVPGFPIMNKESAKELLLASSFDV